jgi:hypothetical protein
MLNKRSQVDRFMTDEHRNMFIDYLTKYDWYGIYDWSHSELIDTFSETLFAHDVNTDKELLAEMRYHIEDEYSCIDENHELRAIYSGYAAEQAILGE